MVDIRKGEGFKTAVLSLYFGLTIGLIYILKPIRSSLFLDQLGAENLRYVYMSEGVALIFVVAAYVWLLKHIPRRQFFTGALLFFASNMVMFRQLFLHNTPMISAIFYVWVSAFSITTVTQFWIMANDAFKPEVAKRLVGPIISACSFGGIVCGFLTGWLTKWVHTENFLLIAAAIVCLCAFLVGTFWNKIETDHNSDQLIEQQNKGITELASFTASKSSYFFLLAGLVIIAKMSSTIIDNQFNRIVEIGIAGKAARTMFLANFMAWMNMVSLVCQFCLTGFFLRRLGLTGSLSLLPAGLFAVVIGTVVHPGLAFGILLKVYDGSMNYSIQQASKEMLFLPMSAKVRSKVKPVIDMLGFRAAKSLSGVYIALAAPLLGLADEKLSVLVLLLLPVWAFLVWRLSIVLAKQKAAGSNLVPDVTDIGVSV